MQLVSLTDNDDDESPQVYHRVCVVSMCVV